MLVTDPILLFFAFVFTGAAMRLFWLGLRGVQSTGRKAERTERLKRMVSHPGWGNLPQEIRESILSVPAKPLSEWFPFGFSALSGLFAVWYFYRALHIQSGHASFVDVTYMAAMLLIGISSPALISCSITVVTCRRVTNQIREERQRKQPVHNQKNVWPPAPRLQK